MEGSGVDEVAGFSKSSVQLAKTDGVIVDQNLQTFLDFLDKSLNCALTLGKMWGTKLEFCFSRSSKSCDCLGIKILNRFLQCSVRTNNLTAKISKVFGWRTILASCFLKTQSR